MKTKYGNKYCPIHMLEKNIIDYNQEHEKMECGILKKNSKSEKENKKIFNPIIVKKSIKHSLDSMDYDTKNIKNNNPVSLEYNVDIIEHISQKNNDELQIKLLILINDDEYHDKVARLIGVVFDDVTKSDDNQDPVTFDVIWTEKDNQKIPASINKYFLFSYIDSQNKVRCFTIFTIYNMLKNNNMVHPITKEPIPSTDVDRAKQLVDIYRSKLGLFKEIDEHLSPESKLRNRLSRLFKMFHEYDIYLEEDWLLNLENKNELLKIIHETRVLILNNIDHINPVLQNLVNLQEEKIVEKSIFHLKEYIVEEWEKMISVANNTDNNLHIWIIISSLSCIVPEIKKKYPNIEIV